MSQKEEELADLKKVADAKEIEAREATEKLNRQRDVLRQNG